MSECKAKPFTFLPHSLFFLRTHNSSQAGNLSLSLHHMRILNQLEGRAEKPAPLINFNVALYCVVFPHYICDSKEDCCIKNINWIPSVWPWLLTMDMVNHHTASLPRCLLQFTWPKKAVLDTKTGALSTSLVFTQGKFPCTLIWFMVSKGKSFK